MRIGVLQLNSSDDPDANLAVTLQAMAKAADLGAGLILTPEVTNCVSASRQHQEVVLYPQDDDPTLAAVRTFAQTRSVSVLLGSVSLKTGDPDGRFANRSFLIDPFGNIAAWYDKIHMFDVTLSDHESYHESKGYRPGTHAVVAASGGWKFGMTICYDLRFPTLYRHLAQAGADILTVPSAFSPVSGAAHWEALIRARAIETGCYVIAPAQTGNHSAQIGKSRRTYGHSLVVSPWGEVLLDAGEDPGVFMVDINHADVEKARRRIPSLFADQSYKPAE